MNRIDAIFRDLRARRGRALMPFITAGDPDLATTEALLPAIDGAGAAICEIGFPFSDPIADGPVIQASMTAALASGTRPGPVLDMVGRLRSALRMGLVAMVSYSIVHRCGEAAFVAHAQRVGIDGFIIPDLPLEESDSLRRRAADAGMICSLLIAPTTPLDRAQRIAAASSGFIYLLARAGVTGEAAALPTDLGERIARLRAVTPLPVAVGFGVSSAAQVRQVVAVADAAIVGSAIMRRVADQRTMGSAAVVRSVAQFVGDLAQGLTP